MDKENLFLKLKESDDFGKAIGSFLGHAKNSSWILLQNVPDGYGDLESTRIAECIKRTIAPKSKLRKTLIEILECINEARDKKSLEQFRYCNKGCGACLPLVADEEIFGYVVICGLANEMSSRAKQILVSIVSLTISKVRGDIELEEVNKTIRPRAIALSTVHTLHRLMTSTLDLNELLPRIARLSLQVLRVNRCSIKLVDKKRLTLLPHATIDLRKEKTKLKKVEIGKYAPGRAVKKGTPIRGKRYLAVPMIDEDVVGVITLYDKLDGSEFTHFDEEIMKTLCEQAAVAVKNAQLYKEQADLTFSSISCIAQLLENRPHGVKRPEASCVKLISIIGPKFNMNESELKMLQYAAMLHDAGQISIPEKVLMKRGELTGRELDMVKAHPKQGAKVLAKFKPLKPIVPIILYHHENYDGTGYPKGIKGKDIPLAARILAIVASFEAMVVKRPYRKALPITKAIKEVQKNAGTQFDPEIVEVFCDAIHRKDVRKVLEKELGKK